MKNSRIDKNKILLLFSRNEVGGATKSFLDFAKEISKIRDITVLTPKKGFVYSECIKNNINTICIPYFPVVISKDSNKYKTLIRYLCVPLLRLYHDIIQFYSLKKLSKLIDLDNVKIIHSNLIRDDFGAKIANHYNIKHIMHLREFGELDYEYIKLKKDFLVSIDKYTDKYIAISNSIKNHYISKGLNENKIFTIYNGVNVNNIDKKKNPFLEDDILKIVFAGGITKNKGQLEAIKALSLLNHQLQKNIYLDFYGLEEKEYVNQIKKYIVDSKIESKINFCGYNDITKVLSKYDVGLMCSVSEAFGRTTIEYMSAGLITIASDRGANGELINDGINGFLYKDEKELSEIISNIYYKKYDLEKVSQAGMKYASSKFTKEINCNNINKLYNSIE